MSKKFKDGYTNLVTNIGTKAKNTLSASQYVFNEVTGRNIELEAMYRTSWMVGNAVDIFSNDMIRKGIEIKGSLGPNRIKLMQNAFVKKGVWDSLLELLKWGRLYGGAIAVIEIVGQDPSTPLKIDTISQNQFKGLTIYDRWNVTPDLTNVISIGPEMGNAIYYTLGADLVSGKSDYTRVHHSRVIKMIGFDLPMRQKITEQMWGQSVIERIYDILVSFDSATMGASNLLDKAYLRTFKIADLREVLAAGGQSEQNLYKMFDAIRLMQSAEGITLLDSTDEFQTANYSFTGIPDILLQFAQQLSGAVGIPLVKLLGQSPSGLNSTGESDFRMYYDNIASQQETRLRTAITKIMLIIYNSSFAESPPNDLSFDFVSLWQASEKEKAEISSLTTNQIVLAYDNGIITQETALKELKKSSEKTGIFSTITDEDIENSKIAPPPLPQESTNLEPKKNNY